MRPIVFAATTATTATTLFLLSLSLIYKVLIKKKKKKSGHACFWVKILLPVVLPFCLNGNITKPYQVSECGDTIAGRSPTTDRFQSIPTPSAPSDASQPRGGIASPLAQLRRPGPRRFLWRAAGSSVREFGWKPIGVA